MRAAARPAQDRPRRPGASGRPTTGGTRDARLAEVLAAALIGAWLSGPLAAKELRILACQGYADDDRIAEFKAQNDAQVSVVFAQTDDQIWSKMKGSDGQNFDRFAVNTAELKRHIDAGIAVPHDLAKIPHQHKALPQFRDLEQVRGTIRDGKVYGIPFVFDSIGLIYDTTKVDPVPDAMNVLWDPKYKGEMLLYDASARNFSFTALAMGVPDPFNLTDAQLQAVKDKPIELPKNALSYYQSADEALPIDRGNDVALIFANFGQQLLKLMQEAGAPVRYVVPKEGALASLDTWALSTGAAEPELAERNGFGSTVTPLATAHEGDKLVYLLPVDSFPKRSDL